MRRLVQVALMLLASGLVSLHAGEVIDRVAATVNSSAILQSDLDVAVRCEALLDGRQLNTLTAADERAALERLIDQELLRQQMGKDLAGPKPEEVAERIHQVRSQMAGAQTDDGWRKIIAHYGLSETEVAERVAAQMQIARFLEQRLRPNIRVDLASIQAYYNDKFLPQLKNSGGQSVPTLRDVFRQIQEILLQQRMDEDLTAWLRSLREQSRIRITVEPVSPSATGHPHAGPGGNGG